MSITKNHLNAAALLLDEVHSVTVRYPESGKTYTYLSAFDVMEGDTVIVDSPYSGLTSVEVVSVRHDLPMDILDATWEYKFLVSKVDTSGYVQLQDALKTIRDELERKEKKERLKAAREALGVKKGDRLSKAVAVMRARLNENK